MKDKQLNTRDVVLCAMFIALITVGAYIKIPIPNMPFTLQFLFTNLAGIILGARLGGLSVLIYVLAGLIGLPVFTTGGGPGYIFYPTFGYLVGFIVGTYVSGKFIESRELTTKNIFLASIINLFFVYTLGMVHYYIISNFYSDSPIGIGALFLYCFVLAVPGDIFLCFLSAVVGKKVKSAISKIYYRGVSYE